jgi:hypothetical protein
MYLVPFEVDITNPATVSVTGARHPEMSRFEG